MLIMDNGDERSSMDSNVNTEQSLMNNLSCQDLNGWQLSHGTETFIFAYLFWATHTDDGTILLVFRREHSSFKSGGCHCNIDM